MTKHLKGCKPYGKSTRGNQATTSTTISELLNGLEFVQVMSQNRLKERVLRIIVSGNLPFSFADNVELRALLKDAYLDCPLLNRKVVRDYLKSWADEAVSMVKAKLAANESKVSLVLDAWTSRSNLSFLSISPSCVTGHCY